MTTAPLFAYFAVCSMFHRSRTITMNMLNNWSWEMAWGNRIRTASVFSVPQVSCHEREPAIWTILRDFWEGMRPRSYFKIAKTRISEGAQKSNPSTEIILCTHSHPVHLYFKSGNGHKFTRSTVNNLQIFNVRISRVQKADTSSEVPPSTQYLTCFNVLFC